MNHSERILSTLNFENVKDGGAVLETFFPWGLTVDRWCKEGLPQEFSSKNLYPASQDYMKRYLDDNMTETVYKYEQYFGFDGVKRMAFRIPFKCFEEKVLEETETYVIRFDKDGWTRKYYKNSQLVEDLQPVVKEKEDWQKLKAKVEEHLALYCTDENIQKVYGAYQKDHEAGKFSIRFRVAGFFWTPRELFGVEEQMYAFYDTPELIKEINDFILNTYKTYLGKIFQYIKPEVILFEEDLSGSTGPMISPDFFDEFVGKYYVQLVPILKGLGVKNVFVDTDGDFKQLIPNFIETGIDGFIPMDVNAGMDIVEVRRLYPNLKFIGAFNKLKIAEGKTAIDSEFERILPVIRQGGYIPGTDHQVAPSTSYDDYCYYIMRLREFMKQSGADKSI